MEDESTDEDGEEEFVRRVVSSSSVLQGRWLQNEKSGSTLEEYMSYLQGSWFYRWVTADPPEWVEVIDLRETQTVGWWISSVDVLSAGVKSYWGRSGAKQVFDWVVSAVERVSEVGAWGGLLGALTPAWGTGKDESEREGR